MSSKRTNSPIRSSFFRSCLYVAALLLTACGGKPTAPRATPGASPGPTRPVFGLGGPTPTPTEIDTSIWVAGQVTELDSGEPASGASVIVYFWNSVLRRPTRRVAETGVDEEGNYRLEIAGPGTYLLRSERADGRSDEWRLILDEGDHAVDYDLQLYRTARIEGHLVYGHGIPYPGVRIVLAEGDRLEVDPALPSVLTDKRGRFTLSPVEPGPYTAIAILPNGGAAIAKVRARVDRVTPVELAAPAGVTILGRVVDKVKKEPLPEVAVIADSLALGTWLDARAVTSENGEYQLFDVPPGPCRLTVNAADLPHAGPTDGLTIDVPVDRDLTGIDIEIQHPATLTFKGRLLTDSDQPLWGQELRITTPRITWPSTTMYEEWASLAYQDGSFEWENLSPGRHRVLLLSQRFALVSATVTMAGASRQLHPEIPAFGHAPVGQGILLDLTADAVGEFLVEPLRGDCAITGVIMDEKTERLLAFVHLEAIRILGGERLPVAEAASDRAGSFALSGLAPGRYHVVATRLGFETVHERAVELQDGDLELMITMKRSHN